MNATKEQRQGQLLAYLRKRSGRRFLIAILAKEFGVTERTVQSDLAFFESCGLIDRIPCYDKFNRQNGNVLTYTGDRRRQSRPLEELYEDLGKQKLRGEVHLPQKGRKRGIEKEESKKRNRKRGIEKEESKKRNRIRASLYCKYIAISLRPPFFAKIAKSKTSVGSIDLNFI